MDACELMSQEEKVQYFEAIVQYATEGTLPEDISTSVRMAMKFVAGTIDMNKTKHEEVSKRRRESGAKGGKRKQMQANEANALQVKQMQANEANATFAKHNDKDNDNVSCESNDSLMKDKENNPSGEGLKEKPRLFEPPTPDEVSLLASQIGGEAEREAEDFYNHYKANGWVLSGGQKMEDWKAAFRSWLSKVERFPAKKKPAMAAKRAQQYEIVRTDRMDVNVGKKGMEEYTSGLRAAYHGDMAMRAKYPNWEAACHARGIS